MIVKKNNTRQDLRKSSVSSGIHSLNGRFQKKEKESTEKERKDNNFARSKSSQSEGASHVVCEESQNAGPSIYFFVVSISSDIVQDVVDLLTHEEIFNF